LIPGDEVDVSLGAQLPKTILRTIGIATTSINALEKELFAGGFPNQVAVGEFFKAIPKEAIAPPLSPHEALHHAAL
jgi:hypothetical protein